MPPINDGQPSALMIFVAAFLCFSILVFALKLPGLLHAGKTARASRSHRHRTSLVTDAANQIGAMPIPALSSTQPHAEGSHLLIDELAPDIWIAMVTHEPDRAPHVLIAGESGTGKTTVAQAMLAQRGGLVAIADPKPTRPGIRKWGGLAYVSIGIHGDFRAIEALFSMVLAEVDRRLACLRTSDEAFVPLTIIVDEWQTLLAQCPSAVRLYEVATIGRELGMRLIILSTSDQVKALKLDGRGDLRENFRFLRLGDKALIANPTCVEQNRPACLEWRGKNIPLQLETLDTATILTATRATVWPSIRHLTNTTFHTNEMRVPSPLEAFTRYPPDVNVHPDTELSDVRSPHCNGMNTSVQRSAFSVHTVDMSGDVPEVVVHEPVNVNAAIDGPATADELRRLGLALRLFTETGRKGDSICQAFHVTKGGRKAYKRADWLFTQVTSASGDPPADDQIDDP